MNLQALKLTVFLFSVFTLSACVAKNLASSEQQLRMQQCEKYIDRKREQCLRGDFVSIKDYETEYKAFKNAEKQKLLSEKKDLVDPLKVKLDPRVEIIKPAPIKQ